jgi:hypothetical protein
MTTTVVRPRTLERLPLPAAERHQLTSHDLLGLQVMSRRWRRRAQDTRRGPLVLDPHRGFIRSHDRLVHAVRLPRPFVLHTALGSVDGAAGDMLVLTGSGGATAMSLAQLRDTFEPADPPRALAELPAWAARLSAALLGPLGKRWVHTVGVAQEAARLGLRLPTADQQVLLAAAYLHDLGYAPCLARTGFHPLDAALALTGVVPDRVIALIANHSSSSAEARMRGLGEALAHFPAETTAVADALTCADMSISADGCAVGLADRVADVAARYGDEHVVTRGIRAARPQLAAVIARARWQAEAGRDRLGGRGSVAGIDDPAELVTALHAIGFTFDEIGFATGVDRVSVHRWQSGQRRPKGPYLDRLLDLRDTIGALEPLGHRRALSWMRARHAALDRRSPLETLATGDGRLVRTAATILGVDPKSVVRDQREVADDTPA